MMKSLRCGLTLLMAATLMITGLVGAEENAAEPTSAPTAEITIAPTEVFAVEETEMPAVEPTEEPSATGTADAMPTAQTAAPSDEAAAGLPEPAFVIADGVLLKWTGSDAELVIPENLGIVSIGADAFEGNLNLEHVVLPKGLISIEACAFSDCGKLTRVTIPSDVTSIDDYAFMNCSPTIVAWAGSYAAAWAQINGYAVELLDDSAATAAPTSQPVIASAPESAATPETAEAVEVTDIALSKTALTLTTVQSATLTAAISPSDATNQAVVWSTSNAKVAVVNANGVVKAVSVGKARITCAALDSSGKSATCTVTVKKAPKPTSVKLTAPKTKMNKGSTLQLKATVKPAGAINKVSYSSSNKKIATVSKSGLVKAVREGSVTITVKTSNKKIARLKLKIVDPKRPTGVKLDRSGTVKLDIGNELRLTATLSPATAVSDLTWSSSNKKIATVSGGVVTAKKEGTVTIKVRTKKTNTKGKKMSASVKVKVVDPRKATGVKLDRSGTVPLTEGEDLLLEATLTPATATSKITWTSSNKKIATVSEGVVTAIKSGTATITATANGKTATVKIKVVAETSSEGSDDTANYTKICGTAVATAAQMRAYIRSVNPSVPQSVIDMIPLYLSEGAAEGIRGDIAFAQSCLETGNFKFIGSAVTLDQNNFCGMGVTSNGLKGNSFDTPQLGIRAQIQHLKAYASTQDLNNDLIDPRFQYVTRGSAEYVEWLGVQENPNHKGWASGAGYGAKILNILQRILKTGK